MYMYYYIRTHIPARARARFGDGIPDTRTKRPYLSRAASVRVLSEIRRHLGRWRRRLLARRKGASADGFTCAYDLAGSLPVWSEEIHGIHKQDTLSLSRSRTSSPLPPFLVLALLAFSSSSTPTRVYLVVVERRRRRRGPRARARRKRKGERERPRRFRDPASRSKRQLSFRLSTCRRVAGIRRGRILEKKKKGRTPSRRRHSGVARFKMSARLSVEGERRHPRRWRSLRDSPETRRRHLGRFADDAKLATTLRPRRRLSRVDGRRSARARRRKRNGADVRETTRRVLHSPRRRGRDEYTRRKERERETRALARGRTSRARSPPFLLEDGRAIARARDRHGYESWPLWPWHWTCGSRAGEGGTRAADKPAPAEGSAAEWGDAAESRRNVGLGRGVGEGGRRGREGGRGTARRGGREIASSRASLNAARQYSGDSPAWPLWTNLPSRVHTRTYMRIRICMHIRLSLSIYLAACRTCAINTCKCVCVCVCCAILSNLGIIRYEYNMYVCFWNIIDCDM